MNKLLLFTSLVTALLISPTVSGQIKNERKYLKAIAAGDKHMANSNYMFALRSYQDAWAYLPDSLLAIKISSSLLIESPNKYGKFINSQTVLENNWLLSERICYAVQQGDFELAQKLAESSTNSLSNDAVISLELAQLIKDQNIECNENEDSEYCVDLSIAESVDKENAYLKFVWLFSDGSKAHGTSITKCFESGGHFSLSIDAIDVRSNTREKDVLVQEIEIPDHTYFEIESGNNLYTGVSEKFSVYPAKDHTTYYWCTGDYHFYKGSSIKHEYTASGQFTVSMFTVTTKEEANEISCVSDQVKVLNSLQIK